MRNYSGYLGYIKIEGAGVKEGVISAKSAAVALSGFNDSLKYFIKKSDGDFSLIDFEIPVRIQEGSWQALVPHTISQWVEDGVALGIANYGRAAMGELGKNDFKNKNTAEIVRRAITKMKSVAKIGKHVGGAEASQLKGTKVKGNDVEIPNDEGIYLRVTREELETYLKTPSAMLSDLVSAIEKDQSLSIAVVDNNGKSSEEKITYDDRLSFVYENQSKEHDLILPELVHGETVIIEGVISKGNKNTNTIGIEYKGHVLTCMPMKGSIVKYKDCLYEKCQIEGTVSRVSDPMITDAPRPKIRFTRLTLTDRPEDNQIGLL